MQSSSPTTFIAPNFPSLFNTWSFLSLRCGAVLCRTLYAKCEQYNLTGSVKDRMALHILKSSYE
jgi:cysteine synthase